MLHADSLTIGVRGVDVSPQWIDWCGRPVVTHWPPAYLPVYLSRSSARRLLLMALTRLAQPGLQLSVTEPDFIRAITAKVSWTLGVNQWPPPGAGEGVQGRLYCLEYAWKPIGFACLSGHMDPDGIMSDLTLIHIILPSNQYWDLTSHSEGSPRRKLCIYPPARIFSSERTHALWSRSTATLMWWFFWWVCGWHFSLMYLFKALSHCVYLTSVVLFIFFFKMLLRQRRPWFPKLRPAVSCRQRGLSGCDRLNRLKNQLV